MAFLTDYQLRQVGFKFLGKEVKISDKAAIYNAGAIQIDDYSRIDDFSILSAGPEGIEIGKYVHIAAYCSLIGKCRIRMDDFSGLSSRVAIYSSSDDYSGETLTNPCVPDQYKKVHHAPVRLGKHVIVGVATCILPGVTIGEGSAIGAFSLVNKTIESHIIASGVPARYVKARRKDMYDLEQQLRSKNE